MIRNWPTTRARSLRASTDLSALLLARGKLARDGSNAPSPITTRVISCTGWACARGRANCSRSIPGVRLVEMAESDLCCGSAGSYNLTEPAMAHQLARRKADNIEATGADYVVLGNPGCEFQIAAELRRRGSRIRVIHLADFLALVASSGA